MLCSFALIAAGWMTRDERDIAPHEGVGYFLGVVGLGCMVTLLVYSLRKRVRLLHDLGRISSWFQFHMVLGLVGPVAILYHCNFDLGSLNSNVALFCVLVVSGSGVVGRVMYARIHHGLSDRRTSLEEMKADLISARPLVSDGAAAEAWGALAELESRALRQPGGLFTAVFSSVALRIATGRTQRRALRSLRATADWKRGRASDRRRVKLQVRSYNRAIRRVGAFAAYERLFSLWHVLHLPLCFLLFVSATVHVIAVHMY